MCRLFGLHAGRVPALATFWLLEAPDSLEQQSHQQPDGTGLGTFAADGTPVVERQPVAAYRDARFVQAARTVRSTTFVAHIRFASVGPVELRNTHPFVMDGRLLAHNGDVGDLPRLEAELGDDLALVRGDTDSERVMALVTRCTREAGGDVTAGLTGAAEWVATNLRVLALNLILTTATDLWALRYPATHELWLLERHAGGPSGGRHLEASSAQGTVRVRSDELAQQPSVAVASERMDDNPHWRLLDPGELVHVDADLRVQTSRLGVA